MTLGESRSRPHPHLLAGTNCTILFVSEEEFEKFRRINGCADCTRCGFDEREQAARNAQIRENGLTLCPDGLRRLIIPRKRNEQP